MHGNLTVLQRFELFKMEKVADARGTFSSQNYLAQVDHNVEQIEISKRNEKTKPCTIMPTSSPIRTYSPIQKGLRSSTIGPTIIGMYTKLNHDDIDDAIIKFIFSNHIHLCVTRSPYYKEMVIAITALGPSYVPLGEHKLRIMIFFLEKKSVILLLL